MTTTEIRSEKIDIMVTPSAKRALEIAASAAQMTVSEFVLESALERAAEALPDRRQFGLDEELMGCLSVRSRCTVTLDAPPEKPDAATERFRA